MFLVCTAGRWESERDADENIFMDYSRDVFMLAYLTEMQGQYSNNPEGVTGGIITPNGHGSPSSLRNH